MEDGDSYDDIDKEFEVLYMPYLIMRKGKIKDLKYTKIKGLEGYFKSYSSREVAPRKYY